MFVESMATALVVGKIRGGRIKNIEKVNVRAWYLFIVGFVLEFGSTYLKANNIGGSANFISDYFFYIHGLSYLLIFTALILNFNKKSMMIIFIGTLLNFIVIMSNGGQMPVSGVALERLGLIQDMNVLRESSGATHTLLTDDTNLALLGDIIPLSRPYPLPKVISVGDIFLALGVFLFLQKATLEKDQNKIKKDVI